MTALRQYGALSARAISHIIRQPAVMGPALVFPLIFMSISASALDRSTSLPGFPRVDSFFQFMLPATILQASMFGAIFAGADMATDIEDGFFDRLVSSPVGRTSILVGRVAGAALLAFTQAWIFFGITAIFGVHVKGGLPAMLAVSGLIAILAAGAGSLMVAFGLKSGSTEAVQGIFPLVFVFLFSSSAFFPAALMHGWFRRVVESNPLTGFIDGVRYQVITGFDFGQLSRSILVAAGVFVLGVGVAALALRGRLSGSGS